MKRAERLEWFNAARYGLFIHWGLYAQLGGIWNGVHYPHGTEWIMRNAQIPLAEYRKLAETFDPVDFDAEAWASAAESFGSKYLCFTAKHHDGFAMYDSKVSDYNIMHTPFGRDVVKELAEACRRHNIKFCLYYSQMQDWEDPDGDGNTWDFRPEEKHFERYFENKVKPQLRELLTNYGEIGMIWFDTPYDMPVRLCRELQQYVHSIQPDCVISGRIGYGLGDFREMGDNEIPVLAYQGSWETPMTLNNTWSYSKTDENWKTPQTVIKMLIDVVGKGGNLLMNVGPDELGRFPEGSTRVLRTIGKWLEKNGESIYGAGACADFPFLTRWGGFTLHDRVLYVHILRSKEYPDGITIRNLQVKVRRAWRLDTGKEIPFRQSYEIARDEYRLVLDFCEEDMDPLDMVIAVELEEALRFHGVRQIFQPDANGEYHEPPGWIRKK